MTTIAPNHFAQLRSAAGERDASSGNHSAIDWRAFESNDYSGRRNRPTRDDAMRDHTTLVVQHHLERLAEVAGDASSHPIVKELLAGATNRLHLLCVSMLFRSYPRLTKPPLNLQPEELLSSVVERMIKAMREVRPQGVRQFFSLASQHMRWELNDLARRLDKENRVQTINESLVAAPEHPTTATQVTPNARRILQAIEKLPTDERDVFELVRIQGMSQGDAAMVLGVCHKTVQRRLGRALILLAEELGDLQPAPHERPC